MTEFEAKINKSFLSYYIRERRKEKNMKIKPITYKQLEIIIFLYRFRFLTVYKFQRLLNHKSHDRIRIWLNDLLDKGLIGKIKSEELPNIPAYYFLENGGIKILRDQEDIYKPSLKKLYEEGQRTQKFIDSSLFIVHIYLKFKELCEDKKFRFKTKIEMEKSDFLPEHLPDAYISIQEKKKAFKRYFLFLFDEGTPQGVMEAKIKEYIRYSCEGQWEENTGHPFPDILIICPTYYSKDKLQKSIIKLIEDEGEEDISFYLITKQNIEESGVKQEVWEKVSKI